MEKIKHAMVTTNGIKMHVASVGSGPVILFLHGFPELWYSWYHQLLSLSSLGYRRLAPDLRGYGDTDAPHSAASYTVFHIVGDIVGLLDAFGVDRVYFVGHDWDAMIAWYFCQFRPNRVKDSVNLNVAYRPENPNVNPVEGLRALFGDDYFVCRFQEPGEIEDDFAQVDTAKLIKLFLTARDPRPPGIPKEIGFRGFPDPPALPSWLLEEDINYFASKFNELMRRDSLGAELLSSFESVGAILHVVLNYVFS